MDAVEDSGELFGNQGNRYRAGDLHLASAAGKEVAKEHAQLRNRDREVRWNALHGPTVEGVGAAISPSNADECNRVSGQKLTEEEEKMDAEVCRCG